MIVDPASSGTFPLRSLGTTAVCILLVATLFACTGGDEDSTRDEQALELEAKLHSLEAALEALADENAELRGEIAILGESLDDLDERLRELEEVTSKVESVFPDKGQWTKDERVSLPEGTVLERTVRMVEDSGGEVHYVDHSEREDRSVLVTPVEFVDGETPLIVSLHGFGGNSADQIAYVPLHERVNTDGFALLLPNGTVDGEGNRFWNPTDQCCDGGKSGEDDVAYLTELVEAAREGQGVRAGVLLWLLQRRVYVVPHGLQGSAGTSRRGQPGRDELCCGLELRRRIPPCRCCIFTALQTV